MYNGINSFVMLGQNYRSSCPELFLNKSHSENFLKIHCEKSHSRVLLYKVAGFQAATSQD